MSFSVNWAPFKVAPQGQWADPPRSLDTLEGVGDRLRAAAFAEIQAREAFLWAAARFDEPEFEELRAAWVRLARAEDRHLGWLIERMKALKIEVAERQVSDQLWHSLVGCSSAERFAHFMANAEERGRKAGERFHQALLQRDPETARIFGQIAFEEREHIALAERFFPRGDAPRPFSPP